MHCNFNVDEEGESAVCRHANISLSSDLVMKDALHLCLSISKETPQKLEVWTSIF